MVNKPGRFIGNTPVQQPQEQTQPATQPAQPNVLGQIIQEERVSNFISQTSPTATLERINYILKGFVYDDGEKEWVKVADGITEQIRLDFLQFITPTLSEDTRMNNLQPQQINGIMEFVIEWVLDYLDIKADTDPTLTEENMSKIALIIFKAIFYALTRSQSGIERSKMFGALKLGAEVNPTSQPQSSKNPWWQFWS